MFSEVPIKELREDKLTELALDDKGLGPAEGIVIAKLVAVTAVITKLDLNYNFIGPDGAKALAEALRVNAVLKELNLANNQLCGINPYTGEGTYDASGIQALAAAIGSGSAVLTMIESVFRDSNARAAPRKPRGRVLLTYPILPIPCGAPNVLVRPS